MLYAEKSFPSWERGLKLNTLASFFPLAASFPSWERGLKQHHSLHLGTSHSVVPLVGTWIETDTLSEDKKFVYVVPLVGTWIETEGRITGAFKKIVVPLVGTWIETQIALPISPSGTGRSPRGNVD